MDADRATRERTLRAAALGGDESAWVELFHAAYDQVFRYAVWRCGGRTDLAEDVAQEAWLLAAGRLRAFDPARGPFAAWVCGLAANVARNAVRRRMRDVRRLTALAVPEPDATEHGPEIVAVALAELTSEHEQVLRAKYFHRLSVGEIAASSGRTAKAVESLLTRAREAFRTAYLRLGGDA